jgi:hypothetical protein
VTGGATQIVEAPEAANSADVGPVVTRAAKAVPRGRRFLPGLETPQSKNRSCLRVGAVLASRVDDGRNCDQAAACGPGGSEIAVPVPGSLIPGGFHETRDPHRRQPRNFADLHRH